MNTYFKQLESILTSNEFRDRLEQVNDNFPNLKQEHLIRDVILSMYNQQNTPSYRAFSEHPRKWELSYETKAKKKIGRVDLSFNKAGELDGAYKIELKFFFTKDIKNGRDSSVEKNFIKKECDLLMIIVQEFLDVEAKVAYDQTWGIDTNLLRYQLGANAREKQIFLKSKVKFKSLEEQFERVENGQIHDMIEVEVHKPYKTRYTFCFLERVK
ncbi:hypothetical protein HXZ88_05270 [Myroides odoratimimus]|uniref:hypothetical protein n=1 Tax=Myroides odoratimimus TaxID=76832 RepID=UPI0025784FAA|nr:hypothetical protein [Myroides odoratimimus]MDM1065029.1 hypothetical protein [Myroides odoratimimus]